MNMYGLFYYTYESYDHFAWETLDVVSRNEDNLVVYCNKNYPTMLLAENEEEHKKFSSEEVDHYMIKELEVI